MFNYKPYIKSLIKYMLKENYTVKPLPKIILNNKKQKGLFISTGRYIPEEKTIELFVNERHPKDVLRSLAHELIHHKQYMDGKLDVEKCNSSKIIDNDYIIPFEKDAYLNGNISFRSWTEEYTKGHKEELEEVINEVTKRVFKQLLF